METQAPKTPAFLRQVREVWKDNPERENIMLWAVMCLCFFGFLRSGEVVAPGDCDWDPTQHLTFSDVKVDSNLKHSFQIGDAITTTCQGVQDS